MAEGQGVDRAQQDAGQEQAAAEPSPENVLSGLQVQEKNLRELRRTLFTRLFQLQAEEAVLRAKLPEELQQQYPPGVEALTGEEGTGTRTAASK